MITLATRTLNGVRKIATILHRTSNAFKTKPLLFLLYFMLAEARGLKLAKYIFSISPRTLLQPC